MATERDLRQLLESSHEASYGWALHCCGRRPAEAEEVLQNVYVKVLDGRARYDGRASFKTWLFAVIRRTAADERRRQWLQRLALLRYEQRLAPAPGPKSAPEILQSSRLQGRFQEALVRLPGRQQEVLHLVFYQDLTIQQAAEIMGVSLGSARQHYERGKQKLRELLGGEEVNHER